MIGASTARRRAAALLAACLLVATAACSSDSDGTDGAPDQPADGSFTVVTDELDVELTDALNDAGETAFAETTAPGAVMAIRTSDGTWAATVGFADRDQTEPMAADVNQRVGSITKTFTVTALLQLAEDGELSLDDPIDDYVEGMPNGDATLGELAEMRSGIPSYTFDETFQDTLFGEPDHQWEPQELVDLVKGDEPMFEPGTAMFYSNTNTVLLGMVIEQVTGESLGDVLAERIVEPLGLEHTELPADAAYPEPHPHGYTLQGADDGATEPLDATDWNPSWAWAAGGIVSNLDDLLTWGEALGTGEGILDAETQAARLDSFDFDVPVVTGPDTTAPQTPARAYGQGLGLALDWYGHEGELPGFNTYVQHHEPEGVTLVVMVNSDISSGADCTDDQPTLPDDPGIGPCLSPASRIGNALAAALELPLVEPAPAEDD